VTLDEARGWALDAEGKLWFAMEIDRKDTRPLVLDTAANMSTLVDATWAYAMEHGLSEANARYVLSRALEARAQVRRHGLRCFHAAAMQGLGLSASAWQVSCPLPSSCREGTETVERLLCISIDGQPEACYEVSRPPSPDAPTTWH
jgi:hypothetical protein